MMVELWDELPRVGSGFRGFKVLKRGNKWVYAVATDDQTLVKMKIITWDKLRKHELDRRGVLTGRLI